MKKVEYGWLAGIIDGEGSIGIAKRYQRGRSIYTAQVQVTSCDKRIVDEIVRIINLFGIEKKICVSSRKRKGYIGVEYYLNLQRLKDVKILIEEVKEYIVSKKRQSEFVLEFVDHRIKVDHRNKRDLNGKFIGGTYTKRDEELYQKLKKLNKKRRKDDVKP